MKAFRLFYRSFPDNIIDVRGITEYDVKRNRFTILINTNLSAAEQQHTLRHELSHIALNHHFQLDRSLEEVEDEADHYADVMSDDVFNKLMAFQQTI